MVVTVNTSAQYQPAGSKDYEEERWKLDLAIHRARLVKEQRETEMLEAKKATYVAKQAAQEAARAASEADAALKTFMLRKNM